MVCVLPFRGVRYDVRRVPMDRAVCPPYDVISPRLAERLRARPYNAIHLELPEGDGGRYRRAAALWRRWRERGVLARDEAPCFYVVEQTFVWGGRRRLRMGLLAALDLGRCGEGTILRHEKTLAKPKADRLRLLSVLRVNTSPIFGLFSDKGGAVRAALRGVRRTRAAAEGRSPDGSRFRLWLVKDTALQRRLERAFAGKPLLIADGHHRFEVARAYFRRRPAARGLLAYLCAEQDPGLLVLPTHRVIFPAGRLVRRAQEACRLSPRRGLRSLVKAVAEHPSPYAFGLFEPGRWPMLAVPKSARGVRSGLCVEWLAKRLTARVDPQRIAYTHDAAEAVRLARERGGVALLVKPAGVARIRRAVDRVGLLPQKSTYFHPKVASGLVFNPLEEP